MSGGGGGGHTDAPRPAGRAESDEDGCRSRRFRTNLEPVPDAPVQEVGAVLAVVPTADASRTVFVAVDGHGQAVGTIVENLDWLLRCTEQGVSYEAEVKEVFLGTHDVLVRPNFRTGAPGL